MNDRAAERGRRARGAVGASVTIAVALSATVAASTFEIVRSSVAADQLMVLRSRMDAEQAALRSVEAEVAAIERERFMAVDLADALRRDIERRRHDLPSPATDLEWAIEARDAALSCVKAFTDRLRIEQ